MKPEELLAHQIKEDRMSSSYIFYGSDVDATYSHTIKLADSLGVSQFGITEIEPEIKEKNSRPEIRVSAVREFIRMANLTPSHGKIKFAIIKNADSLNVEAANTLLKILEEPPRSLIIILLSSDMKLLPTIVSRCQVIKFPDKKKVIQANFASKFTNNGEKLKTVFADLDKISSRNDLGDFLESMLAELQVQLVKNPNGTVLNKIKKIFQAQRDLLITTNKRLVLENLYLEIS